MARKKREPVDAERLLDTAEAAEHLRCTATTITAWIREGKLPAQKLGQRWRVKLGDLQALLKPAAQ